MVQLYATDREMLPLTILMIGVDLAIPLPPIFATTKGAGLLGKTYLADDVVSTFRSGTCTEIK